MVIWSAPAKKDLKNIHDYIAMDSVYYAKQVTETIISKTEILNEFPEMGRVAPEIGDKNIRENSIYSYRIIYKQSSGNIEVLTYSSQQTEFFLIRFLCAGHGYYCQLLHSYAN